MTQKISDLQNFCHTPLNYCYRLSITLELLVWNSRWTALLPKKWSKQCQTPHNNRSELVLWCFSSERHFYALTVKISLNPVTTKKKDQCAKYCHAPLNIRIHLVFWWISPKRHFATLTLKFLLNPITKETMTNLQNTVKRRGIIVVRKCFAADHQCDVLELLLWNSRRTPFWPKIWPICKTQIGRASCRERV